MVNLLELFGFSELSKFISDNMIGFYESKFIQSYLPKVISETFNTPMSLKSIIETSDFFEGAMFYYTEN
jgi:hypothetical protein